MPIASAQTPAAVDEERRLLYVALTRSEEELWCSWFEGTGDERGAGASGDVAEPVAGAHRAGDRGAREGGGADGGGEVSARVAELRRRLADGRGGRRRRTVGAGKVGSTRSTRGGGGPSHVGTPGAAAQGRRREPTSSPATSVHADYTHDEALTAAPVVPLALVLPGSTGEVAEVLRLASEHDVPVVARGSGTGLSGAAVPVADGILLAFDRMNRIREIDTENQVAVVEPGRHAGAAQRRAGAARADLPGLARRAERLARRERGHQRRRHARRPLRGDPPPRPGARGGAGRRDRPAHRRQVRQVLERATT